MPCIRVLDPHIADLIAAGEVVERPAGAAKELIENAVDAGASAVTIELRRGGIDFLRVTDDGRGMSGEDARLAFQRHATSKIRTREDLFQIKTLGFRGEALAAIAAVSRLELMTRERGAAFGTALSIQGGTVTDEREAGCPEGTTIVLRDLFYNTPARQKFLKKDATEAGHIQDAATRAALGHPDISFRLLKDQGQQALHTPGDGALKSAVYSLFGRDFGLSLLETLQTFEGITVSGFVCKPEAARASRTMQYFFVNGRPVRSRTLSAAVEEGFQNMLPAGKIPACVLHIDLPSGDCDINIHPAKAEIKFARDRTVFDAVFFAAKAALSKTEAPQIRLPVPVSALPREPDNHEQQAFPPSPHTAAPAPAPSLSMAREPVSFEDSGILRVETPTPAYALRSPAPARELQLVPPPPDRHPDHTASPPPAAETDWRFIGQVFSGFLLVEDGDALWMIDKHAAHERILFNRLKNMMCEPMTQMLLQPLTVALPRKYIAVLLGEEELLFKSGFLAEDFGGVLLLRALPDFLPPEDAPGLLEEMAEALLSGGKPASLREEALRTVACKAAIKLTTKNAPEELRALAAQVMSDPELRHCPHGRPIAIRMTRSQVERQFLR